MEGVLSKIFFLVIILVCKVLEVPVSFHFPFYVGIDSTPLNHEEMLQNSRYRKDYLYSIFKSRSYGQLQ